MTMTSLAPAPMATPAIGWLPGSTEAPSSGVGAKFAALIDLNLNERAGTSTGESPDGEPSVPATDISPAGTEILTSVDPSVFQLVAGTTVPEADHSEEPAPGPSPEGGQTSTATAQLLVLPPIAAALRQIAAPAPSIVTAPAPSIVTAPAPSIVTPPAPSIVTAPAQLASRTPAAAENVLTGPPGNASTSAPEALAANKTPLATGVVSPEPSLSAVSAQKAPSSSDGPHETIAAPLDSAVPSVGTQGPVAGSVQIHRSGTTPAASVPHTAVTNQVFPDVARLMTRADGTQRITLRLTPDNLGEVKIVLTVRDGAVQVDLSASTLAAEALRSGAHQLHRLLELAGATSSQIRVIDPSTGNSTTPSDSQSQDGFARPGSDGTGRQSRYPDHHARMRDGDTLARDGSTPGAASPLTMPNQDSPAPYLGVDVTI